MNKSETVRCSRWSTPNLTSEQTLHAGLDAIKSLEVYCKIYQLPDLCQRLQPDDFEENLKVDVMSPNGSMNTIIHAAAHATISSLTTLRAPPFFTLENLKVGKTTAIVKVTEVMAPNIIISGVKKTP